jgi:hypothetical protein
VNDCAREIEWGGGKHVFCLNRPDVLAVLAGSPAVPKMARLKSGRAFRLETLTGSNGNTPAACLRRFDDGAYSVADIERVMLYGLWGGGLSVADAHDMIATHVRGKPLARNAEIAFTVLAALFLGAEKDATASA